MNATLTPTKETFQNYAQLRAKHAWAAAQDTVFKGKEGGEAVKKVPAMIIENGLLGAMAFAIEKGEGYLKTFEALRNHLVDLGNSSTKATKTVGDWFDRLASSDAETLRLTTSECMAYLAYLRRFAKKDEKKEE